ncbi:hypothetical protein [Bradyrhizobium sp. S69]|uniref:hypothetical protein n=1 Tax=Bradyrhizobium sp. S69 TaxID=1641856 RepID=UPI00131BE93B|nr:hypothetical protein [Bradyrhizobium sp. S69]
MEDERAAPGERPDLERLDFAGLTERDTNEVRNAIARGENFHGYIPAESLGFIIRNYRILAPMGALEAAWLDACGATIKMGIRIAASEIVPEGRFVASFKMLPLAVALFEASRSRSALSNAL